MKMIDDIIAAEEKFFHENLVRPTMIIVSPEGFAQLKEEVQGTIDYSEMYEFSSYEGMTIAVTTKLGFPQFKLGFVG